jgi:hypothetical protein
MRSTSEGRGASLLADRVAEQPAEEAIAAQAGAVGMSASIAREVREACRRSGREEMRMTAVAASARQILPRDSSGTARDSRRNRKGRAMSPRRTAL